MESEDAMVATPSTGEPDEVREEEASIAVASCNNSPTMDKLSPEGDSAGTSTTVPSGSETCNTESDETLAAGAADAERRLPEDLSEEDKLLA